MKLRFAALICATCMAVPALAQEENNIRAAQQAAAAWLVLTDSGQYAQSWERGSSKLQAEHNQPDWEQALKAAREPLGALRARKLISSTPTSALPGGPVGDHVVLQFDTQFENRFRVIETVTPMREIDGTWRVSGYSIK